MCQLNQMTLNFAMQDIYKEQVSKEDPKIMILGNFIWTERKKGRMDVLEEEIEIKQEKVQKLAKTQ